MGDGRLDVLARLVPRASGRLHGTLRAGGQTHAFSSPIGANGQVRITMSLPSAMRGLRTGLIELTYPGDDHVAADHVRVRAATGRADLALAASTHAGRWLRARGTISKRARGVVRVRYAEIDDDGRLSSERMTAKIEGGRWTLARKLGRRASRPGMLSVQFSGYRPRRIHGEQINGLVSDVVIIVQDDAELLHRSRPRIAANLDDLGHLGVDWVRVTAGWSAIAEHAESRAPGADVRDPTTYPDHAWSALDRLGRLVRERGMRLAIDIAFWAPRWAVRRPGLHGHRERDGISAESYAAFAEAVARRYPDAAAFTIWNEPNHSSFFLPQWERGVGAALRPASPHRYRAMLEAAVPRVRAAAPGALVLIGATSSVGSASARDPGARMAPMTFVRELACVDERLEPLAHRKCREFRPLPGDGFSHHPSSLELPPWASDPRPETVRMGDLSRLSGLLAELHARGRTRQHLPLYLTEFGYQTDPPDPTQGTSLEQQARWLAESERTARSHPTVRSVAQFLIRDLPARAGDHPRARWRDYQSGLRFEDGRPKPAHAAFALSLVARRAGAGRVRFWGLVRPGHGRRKARIAVRTPQGSWETLRRVRTWEDGTFVAHVRVDQERTFRVEAAGREGPAIRGAR